MGKNDLGFSQERFNSSVPPSPSSSHLSSGASNFHLTNSSDEIITSHRHGTKKRRRVWVEDEFKSKKLSFYYNDEYREILNSEIQQITFKANQNDLCVYSESQIGSSIWSAEEKAFFFAALDTLGKRNIRGISQRIGSKSELEVQEYLLTLQCNKIARKNSPHICTALDIPFAREISEKCCSLLERTSDAIAAQQEILEVNTEQEKWNNIWLITKDICREFTQGQNYLGEIKSMEKFKPIETLFKLENWLQLSKRLFMNNATCEEENWEFLAEPGEMPAIRATALEDFYSLAISITKRIVSATLFCTMSRLRAKSLGRSKYPEINPDDVKAAIRTLELKLNGDEFWVGCARRCKLDVVNEIKIKKTRVKSDVSKGEYLSESSTKMSYDEVEKTLKFFCQLDAKKTSGNFVINDSSPVVIGDDGSKTLIHEHELNENNSGSETRASSPDEYCDTISEISSSPHIRPELRQMEKLELAQESQEVFIDEIDMKTSLEEEMMFWKILKHEPPIQIDVTKIHDQPVPNFIQNAIENEDWRSCFEYHSEWESLDRQTSDKESSFDGENSSNGVEQSKELDLIEEQYMNSDETEMESDKICDKPNSEDYDSFSISSENTNQTLTNFKLVASFQPLSDEDGYEGFL